MERRQRNIAAAQKAEASGRWLSQWLPRSPLEAAALASELSPEGEIHQTTPACHPCPFYVLRSEYSPHGTLVR